MKKTLTRKQKESYQCILNYTKGKDSQHAKCKQNNTYYATFIYYSYFCYIISIFQNQAVGVKWIYPQNPGIAKSN